MNNYLEHHGIKGMKWGIRRYQNEDGSLTPEGQRRYVNKLANKALFKTAKGNALGTLAGGSRLQRKEIGFGIKTAGGIKKARSVTDKADAKAKMKAGVFAMKTIGGAKKARGVIDKARNNNPAAKEAAKIQMQTIYGAKKVRNIASKYYNKSLADMYNTVGNTKKGVNIVNSKVTSISNKMRSPKYVSRTLIGKLYDKKVGNLNKKETEDNEE